MKVYMLAAFFVGSAFARCPNDCNGKGICNSASVCECYSNYIGNDCSQRLCNFGKAWIDTNVGDLNANGIIDTDQQVYMGFANTLVGEQYDPNYGIARTSNTQPWDEAHFYRECSNKGICNRKTGLCECFPGFEGEGCRRMSCPLDCNGHGKCLLIEDEKKGTEYTLWDQDKVQGCKCDPGYSGPDCSHRECPKGADPVEFTYTNTDAVYKLEFKEQKQINWNTGELPNGPTYFTMTYTDDFGDEWTTHAITLYYQANCHADTTKWDPATSSTSKCTSTPFVANPTMADKAFGDVRDPDFLDKYYTAKNFLFDDSFIGEQVNNTLKHLPNDKVRAPYVWTVYNPVKKAPDSNNDGKSPNADKGFLYPAASVPNFDAAVAVPSGANPKNLVIGSNAGNDPSDTWWQCHADDWASSKYCSKYTFADGPSAAANDPKYRFPIFNDEAALDKAGKGQNPEKAAAAYLDCDLWSVCIFIRIPGARGDKKLSINYHYKPANYYLKATKSAPAKFEADITDYDVAYGAERRGNDQTAASTLKEKIVTLSNVGSERKWIRNVDGDPVIDYQEVAVSEIHSCSRRGLCDFDTGKCACFFGYTGNNCHVRTPSKLQGL